MADKQFPTRSQDTPATQGMLLEFRSEMAHKMSGMQNQIEGRFNSIESRFDRFESRFDKFESRFDKFESRFDKFESRFDTFDSKFHAIESRFNNVDAKIDALHALVHTIALRMEEQRSENSVVMDGLSNLFQRQERVEQRIDAVEKNVGTLGL